MFTREQQALVEALRSNNWDRVASLLCSPNANLQHHGQMTLYGAHDRVDRGYHADGTNKPVPPVLPPVDDGASIYIPSKSSWADDLAGEAGLGVDFERPARFQLLWATKYATVESTGTTETGYSYSDGYECANLMGDRTSTTPIRVFHQGGPPPVGSVTPYLRDVDGLPWSMGAVTSTRVTGYLVDDLTVVDATGQITGVEAICGAAPSDDPLTFANTHQWDATAGALVRVEWHAAHEQYEAYQIDCPETL